MIVLGHNTQVLPTVRLFLAGRMMVQVFSPAPELEQVLAPFPGVEFTLMPPGYASAPTTLPQSGPYVLCVDKEEQAKAIRSWLPRTIAVFQVTSERRGRTSAPGFLPLLPPPSQQRQRLFETLATLRRVDALLEVAHPVKQPLILLYGDPDPDAIGAAVGLQTLWQSIGKEARIRYTGEISRYQNELLVRYLDPGMEKLRDEELATADLVAVVDAQPGFWKERPPQAQVVIDHHPECAGSQAAYSDIRSNCGATCSIICEYLVESGIPIKKRLATALLYGIITDTADLSRNTAQADLRAHALLHQRADHFFLTRLAKSQIPLSMLDWIAWGISHRVVRRELMLIHFGEVPTPDVLVQVADHMLLTCGIAWVVCAGKSGDTLIVVLRGDGHHQDVGARARAAFGKLGSAGGHRTMGRAEIPLQGGHVDTTVDLLVERLFPRSGTEVRNRLIRTLREHLHGAGPRSLS